MFERILYIITYWLFAIMVWMAATPAMAYDYTIRSSFSSWTASSGFGTCHPYTQSKPCISDGTYAGVDAGNVVFAYTTQTIGATITLESAAQNSSANYYLSLDAMVGPYTASNQSVKYETLAITVYLKNQSGGTIATKTFSQNITNTTMDTYVLELGSFSGVYSMTTYISGKDGGYWNGNYGAVLEAGSVLLSDYDPTVSAPTYSSAPTAAQLQSRTDARGITGDVNGNQIYITQSGNNLDLDIVQYDKGNLVAGTSSTANNIAAGSITGDDNTVSITQGNSAGSFSDDNAVFIDVNGTNNNINIRQGDNVDDAGGHRTKLNMSGNYNTVGINQHNDGGIGSNGHFIDIDIAGNSNTAYVDQKADGDKMLFLDVNGSSNTIDILQQGTGEHFLDVTLGSNQTVDITQDGSGSHAATINMSGYTSGLTLSQSGSTDKTYSLNQICTNSNGCGTTTVNQQ